MRLMKENKKLIIGIIIGVITTSNIALAAYTYNASDISYKNNTVEYALNELNGKADINNSVYSNDEIKVGTWIDGKPIYRKVISTTTGNVNQNKNIFNITSVNAETVVTMRGLAYRSNGVVINIPSLYSSSSSLDEYTQIWLDTDKCLYLRTNYSANANLPTFIIFEYTKTTD